MDHENVDRGDVLPDPAAEAAAAEAAAAAQAEKDAQAAADLAALNKSEDEGEGEKKPEGEEEQGRNEKGQFEARIPKSRFDEAVGKEREAREAAERKAADLEARLREREAEQAKVASSEEREAEISELEKQHTKLLLDGNEEEAAKVMRQIRLAERELASAEAEAKAVARVSATLETERLNVAIATLQAKYPELNEKSERYDDDITEFVLAKQRSLIGQGYTPSAALTKAADDVMDRFAKKPEPGEKKGLEAAAAATKAEERKKAQVAKNIDAAGKQPASLKDSGMDSDKAGQGSVLPELDKLTADEFEKLPESTKQRMRGDII